MVTQNMLRTHEGLFGGKKSDCSRSNQMHLTDLITDIAPNVRTYYWFTISYK